MDERARPGREICSIQRTGCELFGAVDPYADRWRDDLQQRARPLATQVWADVCKAFPVGTPAEVIARNTWILLKRKDPSLPRLLEAVLHFGVPATELIDDIVRSLQASHGYAAPILEAVLARGAARSQRP